MKSNSCVYEFKILMMFNNAYLKMLLMTVVRHDIKLCVPTLQDISNLFDILKEQHVQLNNQLHTALSAKRFNHDLQPFVKRLEKNGKAPKLISCAMMRKLAHLIYGILKNKKPFDVNYI